jgi:hypothetical protein
VYQAVVRERGNGVPNHRLAKELTTTWLTIPSRFRMNPKTNT